MSSTFLLLQQACRLIALSLDSLLFKEREKYPTVKIAFSRGKASFMFPHVDNGSWNNFGISEIKLKTLLPHLYGPIQKLISINSFLCKMSIIVVWKLMKTNHMRTNKGYLFWAYCAKGSSHPHLRLGTDPTGRQGPGKLPSGERDGFGSVLIGRHWHGETVVIVTRSEASCVVG